MLRTLSERLNDPKANQSNNTNNAQFGSLTNQKIYSADPTQQMILSSVFTLLDKLGESDDSSNDAELNDENKKKIEEKEKELASVYSEAGVNSYKELNNAITAQDTKINQIQGELNSIGSSASIQAQIKDYENRLSLEQDGEEDVYKNEIERLKGELIKAERKEEELEQAKIEKVRLVSLLGKADNIKLEINKLNGESTGVDYDVEKETQDIKKFMCALSDFKSSPSEESAKKLKAIYEKGAETGGDNGIDNKSIQKAWDLIKDKVEEYASGKIKAKNAA